MISFAPHRCMTLRFHCRHAVLACVDSSNAFRLFDVPKRRLAECHDHVKFPKPPLGRGSWGGVGSVHPLTGVTFNPEDQTYSMLLYNHRQVESTSWKDKSKQNVCHFIRVSYRCVLCCKNGNVIEDLPRAPFRCSCSVWQTLLLRLRMTAYTNCRIDEE